MNDENIIVEEINKKEIAKNLKEKAYQEDTEAMLQYGLMHYNGDGI